MNGFRLLVVAAALLLACVSVRASSVDSWSAPAAESWPSLEEFASEIELSHAEFLDSVSASSSSTGAVSASSSSAGAVIVTYSNSTLVFSANFSSAADVPTGFFGNLSAVFANASGNVFPADHIKPQGCFPTDPSATNCNNLSPDQILSRRRLLASSSVARTGSNAMIVEVLFVIDQSNPALASVVVNGIASQIKCGSDATCVANAVATFQSTLVNQFPLLTVPTLTSLTAAVAAVASSNPALSGMLTQDLTFISLDDGVTEQQAGFQLGAPTVATAGKARNTNAGYYVLAAILALSILVAAMYMVMHKVDATAASKDTYNANNGVSLAPVPSAEPATGGVAVVNPDEAAPLGAAGQMDYKSVFALRNNVLEHKDNTAAEEDNANQNDVHFILHQ